MSGFNSLEHVAEHEKNLSGSQHEARQTSSGNNNYKMYGNGDAKSEHLVIQTNGNARPVSHLAGRANG